MARPARAGDQPVSELFLEALSLKHLKRSGWKRAGLVNPESVAAHSWGVAWLVLNHAPAHLDTLRALKIALVHDVPEVRVGDITPHDGISSTEKKRLELHAATSLFENHGELFDLWREYEDAQTAEAQFVKECDKLDMALQAIQYALNTQRDTREFIESAIKKIRTPELIEVLSAAAAAAGHPIERPTSSS